MKKKTCICYFNPANYISHNPNIALCEECYISMSDDFEASIEDKVMMSFDEYYDIEEVNDD